MVDTSMPFDRCLATGKLIGTETRSTVPGSGCKCGHCVRARDIEIAELRQQLAEAQKGLIAVAMLINESTGVAGLHLNGDVAMWSELRKGGRFEEWLSDFDAAIAAPQDPQPKDGK